MEELIVKIIFVGSTIGIGTIVFRKIPVLIEISEERMQKVDSKSFFPKLLSKVRKSEFFSFNLIFQKILSKIEVLTVAVHKKTDSKLEKLRQDDKKKRDIKNDNYWKKLKESKNDKN